MVLKICPQKKCLVKRVLQKYRGTQEFHLFKRNARPLSILTEFILLLSFHLGIFFNKTYKHTPTILVCFRTSASTFICCPIYLFLTLSSLTYLPTSSFSYFPFTLFWIPAQQSFRKAFAGCIKHETFQLQFVLVLAHKILIHLIINY